MYISNLMSFEMIQLYALFSECTESGIYCEYNNISQQIIHIYNERWQFSHLFQMKCLMYPDHITCSLVLWSKLFSSFCWILPAVFIHVSPYCYSLIAQTKLSSVPLQMIKPGHQEFLWAVWIHLNQLVLIHWKSRATVQSRLSSFDFTLHSFCKQIANVHYQWLYVQIPAHKENVE